MSETTPRTKKRASPRPNPTSIVGNERDVDVIASIAEAGFLTSPQVERLHFPSRRRAQMRLRDLRDHGLLRAYLPGGALHEPNVYTVTPKGIDLLVERQLLDEGERHPGRCPTVSKLRHGVAIRDVYVSFELAARDGCFALAGFLFEGALQRHPVFHAVGLVPDALAVADGGVRAVIGIEVDLSTETNATISAKFAAWRSVATAGERAFDGRQLRVLVTVPTEARRRSIERLAAQAGLRADVVLHPDVGDYVRARYSLPRFAPPVRAERTASMPQVAVFAEVRR